MKKMKNESDKREIEINELKEVYHEKMKQLASPLDTRGLLF